MDHLIYTALVVLLLATAWQDFRLRAIWWGLLPLMLVGLAALGIRSVGLQEWGTAAAVNAALVVVQLLVITLYFTAKEGRLVNILAGKFGLGDLLFLLVAACAFSVPVFLVWYVGSLLLTLIGFGVWRSVSPSSDPRIPLAGAMALAMLVLLVGDWAWLDANLYSNDILLALLP